MPAGRRHEAAHNIASLLGVMDGYLSDLRTRFPWQMVEIHGRWRSLFVIETTADAMTRSWTAMRRSAGFAATHGSS